MAVCFTVVHLLQLIVLLTAFMEGVHVSSLGALVGLSIGLVMGFGFSFGAVIYIRLVRRAVKRLPAWISARTYRRRPGTEYGMNLDLGDLLVPLVVWAPFVAWFACCVHCALQTTTYLLEYWHLK
jgi:hypothetical protein